MISKRLFNILLLFAMGLIGIQLLSGIFLFGEKTGYLPSEVYLHFAGDASKFIMQKSIEGLLETAVPHFIAISTTIFVFAHFLLFTKVISEKKKYLLIAALFITALLDILAPIGVRYGYMLFAWVKVISFWSFELLMGLLLYTLFLAVFEKAES